MAKYVDVDDTRAKLVSLPHYDEATAPTLEQLGNIIDILEAEIESWLGWIPAATDYVGEIQHTNHQGTTVVSNYPVIDVVRVELYRLNTPGFHSGDIDERNLIPAFWYQDNMLHTAYENRAVSIDYRAGYELPIAGPLGHRLKFSVLSLLNASLKESSIESLLFGDLEFLKGSRSQTTSLSLPKISKSVKYSDDKSPVSNNDDGTVMSRLLHRLWGDRRLFSIKT